MRADTFDSSLPGIKLTPEVSATKAVLRVVSITSTSMKTVQTSAIALMLSLIGITSLQAQHNTIQIAQNHPISTTDAYLVEVPQKAAHKTFDISLYRIQQSMTVCLSVEKAVGEKVLVRLLNTKGEELHRESLGRHTDKYACRFDLGSLTDGAYTVEVRNGAEVMRKLVNLSTVQPVESSSRTLVALN